NGINRLLGQFGFGGGRTSSTAGSSNSPTNGNGNGGAFPQPPQGFGGPNGGTAGQPPQGNGAGNGAGGPGGGFDIGNPGALRLFIEPLASQTAWLLPM